MNKVIVPVIAAVAGLGLGAVIATSVTPTPEPVTVTVTETPKPVTNPDCVTALNSADKLIAASITVTTEMGNHFNADASLFENFLDQTAQQEYVNSMDETNRVLQEQAQKISGVRETYTEASQSCRNG